MNRVVGALLSSVLLVGCSSLYFGALEKIGIPKRSLMVKRVQAARDAQDQGKEEFKSALERFREVIESPGGKLETKYDALRGTLADCERRAQDIRERIAAVESVSDALFNEWEDELDQYKNNTLRRQSEATLKRTQVKYNDLIRAMRAARDRMEPALEPLRDNVLFLKHNLNAQAVGSLGGELTKLEGNVDTLIRDLERSIEEADAFIAELPEE